MAGIVTISGPSSVREGTSGVTQVQYTVTRTGSLEETAEVDYYLWSHEDQAIEAQDVSGSTAGTLYFAVGETTKTITIDIAGDADAETDEVFNVALANPREVEFGAETVVTTTIIDDDAPGGDEQEPGGEEPGSPGPSAVTISGPSEVAEGSGGTTIVAYTVTRSGDASSSAAVDYYLWSWGEGMIDEADVTGQTAGTVYFLAGETTKTIQIEVVADAEAEANGTFHVALANPRGVELGEAAQATTTIVDDDGDLELPPETDVVTISGPASVAEGSDGDRFIEYTVTRDGDASGQAMIDYYLWSHGPDAIDSDDVFGPTAGTLYFQAGELTKTIQIGIVGDSLQEGDETFHVALANARGAVLGESASIGTTLTNDDWLMLG